MIRRPWLSTVLAATLLSVAAPLSAQVVVPTSAPALDVAAQVRRVVPARPVSRVWAWRAYVIADSNTMAATKTFNAIFEKSRLSANGFGGEALNLWKGVFARVAVSNMQEVGSRVVVFDEEAVSLGIPLRLKMRPIELSAGWQLKPMLRGRLVPYAGGGLIRLKYDESSDFAEPSENTDSSFSGSNVFGGLEARVAPWIVAGAELQYRSVKDAIGANEASKEFGESNLGGLTVRFLVGVRR